MKVIKIQVLCLLIILVSVQGQAYALNVKAAYEKESHVQKEIVDEIEALSKPVWDLTFERKTRSNIVYRQSGHFLRSDTIKNRNVDIDVSDEFIQLLLLSPHPQASESVKKILDNHDGLNAHFSHEVSIENASDKTQLKTKKTTRSLDGVVKNSGMSQRYDGLLPGAKECRDNLYSFKGRDYRNLIGCSVIKAIEQKRLVKIDKSEDFTVDMNLNGKDEEPPLVLRCELYELGPAVARTGPGLSHFDTRLCIADHNGTPIVYKRETILQFIGKTPTKTTTRLTYLKFDSISDVSVFDIKKASVCPEPLVKDQKKTRC